MSVSAVIIAVVVSFLAAYSFSRFKPKGTDLIMFMLLSMRMVPAAAVVVPIYLLYAAIRLEGNLSGHDSFLRHVQASLSPSGF